MAHLWPKPITNLIIATVVVIAAIGGIGWAIDNNGETQPSVQTERESAVVNQITFSADGRMASYSGEDGRTALEILRDLTAIDGNDDSGFGFFVTGINGVSADSSRNEYWAFFVDGELASVGAGDYVTSNDEEIRWQIETF